jgi:tRNA A37 threonylcarbamoyladenosine biosynthesis protein TsaE
LCADAIVVVNWGPSARTCLSYTALQISIKGESEFSRRTCSFKLVTTKISATKKQKQKSSAAGSPFLVNFLAKQKSD